MELKASKKVYFLIYSFRPLKLKMSWKKENPIPKVFGDKFVNKWKQPRNQRKFLDDLAIKLNIKNSSDWGRVTCKQFYEFGGGGLLRHYYNGSVFDCLQSVYKGNFKSKL